MVTIQIFLDLSAMSVLGTMASPGVMGRGCGRAGRLGSRAVRAMGKAPFGVLVVSNIPGRLNCLDADD